MQASPPKVRRGLRLCAVFPGRRASQVCKCA
ncbi:hypothetical protein Ahy_B04g070533 isoform C [Arachis hypogaea]|uniref:Uncharacterized protein n=1 Tax=Arachis hypogaea TaxID=3818 RepID=A0A444ZHK0_ARAHY|nr:hypothetical protein Ahy_B04g070533 isoform C [Arachis hypogaea]